MKSLTDLVDRLDAPDRRIARARPREGFVVSSAPRAKHGVHASKCGNEDGSCADFGGSE